MHSFVEAIKSFFHKYFIDPIIYESGYNPVNTFTYGIVLVIAVFGIYKLLEKLKIKIDRRFFTGLLPFIILGSMLRVIEDAKIFHSYWLISPLIYIFIFSITLPSLLFSYWLGKKTKTPYHFILFSFGFSILLIFVKFISVVTWIPFLYVGLLTVLWSFLLSVAKRISKSKFFSPINTGLILTHLFDASTTFVAIRFFGYGEQHVLARFLMQFIGPEAMFIIKIIFIPLVLYVIDMVLKKKQTNRFLKFVVFIIGFAPGLRNLLRVAMGV